MKILVSLNNGPNRGSPNVTGQASSLVRQTLAAPINEAEASISQSVGVAARRLKRWAEEQIEKDPLGSGPEFDLCKKIFLNPIGIATQLANTMVLAQVVQKTKVDVLLDAWERSALSSTSSSTSDIDPNLRLLTRKCCTQADYKKARVRATTPPLKRKPPRPPKRVEGNSSLWIRQRETAHYGGCRCIQP